MTPNGRFWCMWLTLVGGVVGFHLLPHGRDISLPKPLSSLPLALGQWNGVEDPLEQSIINALGVDEYVNRVYRGEDGEPIGLYIGYYRSQQTDETLHSPKNCLPGTGWQPLRSERLLLKTADGRAVLVNKYLIQKGLDRQVVLYWYQSHGRTIASEYTAKIDMVVDAIYLQRTDAALVRINTPISGSTTDNRAAEFAVAILGKLDGLIPR
jgi:EpsI family protein